MADDPTETPSPELAKEAAGSLLTAATTAPEPEAEASKPVPSLDELLLEFENESKPVDAPQVEPPETPQPPAAGHFDFDAEMAKFTAWQREHALEQQVKGLTAEVDQARYFIDHHHFAEAVTAGEKMLADAQLYVPKDFVQTALLAQAAQDPELRAAFDSRGDNPRAYERLLKKAYSRIYESAKAMPDREATADRLAVTQFMRGTSKIPAEKPPRYGDMTDLEFAKEKAKYGI